MDLKVTDLPDIKEQELHDMGYHAYHHLVQQEEIINAEYISYHVIV